MGFRENLKDELTFKDIQTKELAAKTGISLNTLNHYLVQNSASPSAENAVKIATALGVSVEYLVTGKETNSKNQKDFSDETQTQARLYKKYHTLIQKVEKLSKEQITALENFLGML